MKFKPGFDPEENKVTISIETNLLKKYYNNFAGLMMNDPEMPEGTKVEQRASDCAVISFPPGPGSEVRESSVAVDRRKMEKIQDVINEFINSAIRRTLRTTEFIPLHGYPIENMQNEIHSCAQGKRDLCIIGEYSEYLNMEKEHKYTFHQVLLQFGTPEWSDAMLLIYEGNIEELRKLYESKLTLVEWY